MTEIQKPKQYDLEERTLRFFKNIIGLCKKLPRDTVNIELIKQLIRATGSVGANYREANESISKKDLNFRIRISRKEAKKSHYWLQALLEANLVLKTETDPLVKESLELARIFSSIMIKTK
ncbi:four helix bundle protein [Candidatus Shapirobacteria bacterium CG11_big_fil_rev_8_21_14_0_20_40_12]|uniref:Four helix bundle protein n=3 Tax=Candidatus Shapironibacteriota TaxID=1752721 RepID=A0A2M8EV18_9BACT|nr:MAG: four helix bundle protein [Candidatus Shapirobacteria bacterium CG11_big_fil_rev_8_21_14_0_20_40_12]PJC28957.1 MAG: four helix bundle protein [Candidatus Shapirobacteria bacterium CG_4_9_14_0_2_um_filter_40_11]PJC77145.1 MAG: four helix bundle protein [Candidatus Shapirobacteria bacterium CG_4_8_14_3_um_filter_39_11]